MAALSHTVIITLQCRSDCLEKVKKLLLDFLPLLRKQEGLVRVKFYQSKTDPYQFIMCAEWASEEAHIEAHKKNFAGSFFESTKELMARPFAIQLLENVEFSAGTLH